MYVCTIYTYIHARYIHTYKMKKAIRIYVQYIGLEYDFYEKEGGGKS